MATSDSTSIYTTLTDVTLSRSPIQGTMALDHAMIRQLTRISRRIGFLLASVAPPLCGSTLLQAGRGIASLRQASLISSGPSITPSLFIQATLS